MNFLDPRLSVARLGDSDFFSGHLVLTAHILEAVLLPFIYGELLRQLGLYLLQDCWRCHHQKVVHVSERSYRRLLHQSPSST